MPYRRLTGLIGAAADAVARLPPARAMPARLGGTAGPARLWLHGASVGEIASAAGIIRELAARHSLLVTANTRTGRDAAAALGVPAALAPLDTPQAVRRFLDRVRPTVTVTIENELWPNRCAALADRGIRQIVIGARLSARSASRWHRFGSRLIAAMLAQIDALSAQDPDSEARFLALGLPPRALAARVNLKLIGPASTPPLPPGPDRARTLLAASTHQGEEAIVLDAMAALGRDAPRLILAPRHPQRFDDVAALMRARGLTPARRSQGAGAEAPLLLADSMGEMAQWYAASGLCLTGGSLIARGGGHTPWEPAAHSCAILHGPHLRNFTEDYASLDQAGATLQITGGTLAQAVRGLLDQPGQARAMGTAARQMLLERAGTAAQLVDLIERICQE